MEIQSEGTELSLSLGSNSPAKRSNKLESVIFDGFACCQFFFYIKCEEEEGNLKRLAKSIVDTCIP